MAITSQASGSTATRRTKTLLLTVIGEVLLQLPGSPESGSVHASPRRC